jgi:hypothetical protein
VQTIFVRENPSMDRKYSGWCLTLDTILETIVNVFVLVFYKKKQRVFGGVMAAGRGTPDTLPRITPPSPLRKRKKQ